MSISFDVVCCAGDWAMFVQPPHHLQHVAFSLYLYLALTHTFTHCSLFVSGVNIAKCV